MKKVLITGANSYIGMSFEQWAKEYYETEFIVDTIDMIDGSWRKCDFSIYDTVFHVAGIAHADVGKVSEEVKQKYYKVNTKLAIETAKKAKAEGVKQFVFMSSMIVYGDSAPYGKKKIITADTEPKPANFYGDSKWQADIGVRALADENFNVAVLRPPMIYGKGSKGNYSLLAKLAKKLPIFPDVENERSMLYIGNLCEFLCQLMIIGKGGIYFPQNNEYTKTSQMVKAIADVNHKKIIVTKMLNPIVWLASKIPGKIGELVNKAFGCSCYEQKMSEYIDIEYRNFNLKQSIQFTEQRVQVNRQAPKALMIASVASMIDQFNMDNIQLLLEKGYDVDVVANFVKAGTITPERVQYLKRKLKDMNVSVIHVPIPRKILDIKGIMTSYKQVKKLCQEKHYRLVHCHSPIGGVIARGAARKERKKGTKVIYTAHGFHFYSGAPLKNWLLFYPIEKICSAWTDILITINQEDYQRALKYMKAKRVEYIPGIGIDTKKFMLEKNSKLAKREELAIKEEDIVLLSVGELNQNKNHEIIVKAISKIPKDNIYYYIAGKGEYDSYLEKLANDLHVNVCLLGYRTDIPELYNMADLFVFPSFREGLSVALMEAMASGLPCVVSKIRGNTDLIDEAKGGYLCEPNNSDSFADKIQRIINDECATNMGKYNQEKIKAMDIRCVREKMESLYMM